jgi:galactose mutarotase-like enzyme
MGIGWHPYFAIPSGRRDQVRLRIPATEHVETNNLDDVFPTGKVTPVEATQYDFNSPNGKLIGNVLRDDSFAGLQRTNGQVVVSLYDPAAHYGLHIAGPLACDQHGAVLRFEGQGLRRTRAAVQFW